MECEHNKACLKKTHVTSWVFWLPMKNVRVVIPTTYIRIKIDSLAIKLRLPEDKLRRIRFEL